MLVRPTSDLKIMSLSCHPVRGGTTDHAATRAGMKPSDRKELTASGDTSKHEI
jgi:hypothetical protein